MGGSSLFIRYDIGSFRARKAYLRCLSSNNSIARVRAASLINGLIGVVFKVPVIALACLLIKRCRSSAYAF